MASKKSKGSERRIFPRKSARVKVRLEAVGSRGSAFEAYLPAFDVSIGGIFLKSEFFVKLGTELLVAFDLPDVAEPVRVKGVVVREQRGLAYLRGGQSGFAIEFSEYPGDTRQILASFFLAPEVRAFVKKYKRRIRHRQIRDETERLVDLVVGWEMDQLEKGKGALKA